MDPHILNDESDPHTLKDETDPSQLLLDPETGLLDPVTGTLSIPEPTPLTKKFTIAPSVTETKVKEAVATEPMDVTPVLPNPIKIDGAEKKEPINSELSMDNDITSMKVSESEPPAKLMADDQPLPEISLRQAEAPVALKPPAVLPMKKEEPSIGAATVAGTSSTLPA